MLLSFSLSLNSLKEKLHPMGAKVEMLPLDNGVTGTREGKLKYLAPGLKNNKICNYALSDHVVNHHTITYTKTQINN